MHEFLIEAMNFILSEYSDVSCAASWERSIDNPKLKPELYLYWGSRYKINISRDSLEDIYHYWRQRTYINERNQYLWQKELIDLIEGG